ncbi:regulatory protein, luxR family [Streptomyces aidingensis]|uniref:Regulatory protein, luxR family n=2 Tax=Streptomyces aidingensis TaxID=910347 RepID=A0A1I1JZG6_9ACTN|nr:regulatory protein, luxR family [Streptomyces aidingensis]
MGQTEATDRTRTRATNGTGAALAEARAAAAREDRATAFGLLRALDTGTPGERAALTAADLEALADAAWWTGRLEICLDARRRAHAGYAARGDHRRAGYTAWMLFYDYRGTGRPAAATGWLRRARHHLAKLGECPEQSYLAWADAEEAQARGDTGAALRAARRMHRIARRCGGPDLVAMSRQVHAGVLLGAGRTAEAMGLLDEAMCAVTADELSTLFTGWLYCLSLSRCMAVADLGRATEWTEAAMDWCAALPGENPFRGLCRVHRVEVLELLGDWPAAESEAEQVCREAPAHDAVIAGQARYVRGEIHRHRGELAEAEAAYARAHRLGHSPQPGLALLRLAQGRVRTAAAALRPALTGGVPAGPLGQARLLAAHAETHLALGDTAAAAESVRRLDTLADGPPLLTALATTARAALCLATASATATAPGPGGPEEAIRLLHRALAAWLGLRVPYEAARVRMLLAAACRAAGDSEGARLELRAARATFRQLGAAPDARRAGALLGERPQPLPSRLTGREAEVLRLVAAGRTNRAIAAELHISEHTVARHLNNIFAKLDVSSRAAATAYACTHGIA